ncbi:MAG: transglutaminase-like domain-containing protein [Pseudomonadota bacterium]
MNGVRDLDEQPNTCDAVDKLARDRAATTQGGICWARSGIWRSFGSWHTIREIDEIENPTPVKDEPSIEPAPIATPSPTPPKEESNWLVSAGILAGVIVGGATAVYLGGRLLSMISPSGKQELLDWLQARDEAVDEGMPRRLRNPDDPPPPADDQSANLEPVAREGKLDPSKYKEIRNINVLRNGDVLPGSRFDINDPESFSREGLTINFNKDSRAHEVLVRAKKIGEEGRRKGRTNLEIATEVADMVQNNYAPGQGNSVVKNGEHQTIGLFFEQGGCCRHRSALLHMALEKAGVPSRYVRGTLPIANSSPHAWVEVDINGNGSYSHIIDLNYRPRGNKENLRLVKNRSSERVHFEVMGIEYVVDPSQFNVVWRPKGNILTRLSSQGLSYLKHADQNAYLPPEELKALRATESGMQHGQGEVLWQQFMNSESVKKLGAEARAELNSDIVKAEITQALMNIKYDPAFRAAHMDGDVIKESGYNHILAESSFKPTAGLVTKAELNRRRTRAEEAERNTREEDQRRSAESERNGSGRAERGRAIAR